MGFCQIFAGEIKIGDSVYDLGVLWEVLLVQPSPTTILVYANCGGRRHGFRWAPTDLKLVEREGQLPLAEVLAELRDIATRL